MSDAFAVAVLLLREAILLAALGLALSGLDDMFIDAVYVTRRLVRALVVRPWARRLCSDELVAARPGLFAILVPAWDESAVIGPMLDGLTSSLDGPPYRIFVGIYPNDPATAAVLARVADRRIEVVVTERPGPTSKADCLNHLWNAALAYERRCRTSFKAFVLHDAEDIVHPHELRVFDHLIGRFDLVQLPVEPLPDAGSRWVSGHYMDEFAEAHAKDLVVREALGAAVPSAGVACAVSRAALLAVAHGNPNRRPFDPACFTEDYELGIRIARAGGAGVLARIRDRAGRLVATREHFPDTLEAAVRQKSRWLMGIALDGWDRLGWSGHAADQYMLWRDRKPLLTAPLAVLGWVCAASLGGVAALQAAVPSLRNAGDPIPPGGAAEALVALNLGLLVWRAAVRAAFTWRAHGPLQAVLSVPRTAVGALINTAALARAVARYRRIARGRATARWEKTAHRMPVAVP